MRVSNFFLSIIAPGTGHVRSGRARRGLLWVAALVAGMIAMRWPMGTALPLALLLAQAIDAALVSEDDLLSPDARALATVACLVGFVGGAVLISAYWVQAFEIPSGSMIPALAVGDHIFVDKTVHHARRGDVLVFRYPTDPSMTMVKRALAVAGDTIEFRDGVPIVNGEALRQRNVAGLCSYDDVDEENRRQSRQLARLALLRCRGRARHQRARPLHLVVFREERRARESAAKKRSLTYMGAMKQFA